MDFKSGRSRIRAIKLSVLPGGKTDTRVIFYSVERAFALGYRGILGKCGGTGHSSHGAPRGGGNKVWRSVFPHTAGMGVVMPWRAWLPRGDPLRT
jgi:hypothetical protein